MWPQRHRKISQANTTPFNFIQLPQKGEKKWFSQQQSRRKRKVLKEGEKYEFYGMFSLGGLLFGDLMADFRHLNE